MEIWMKILIIWLSFDALVFIWAGCDYLYYEWNWKRRFKRLRETFTEE